MSDLVFILGCVGMAHLFTKRYTPYLATGEGEKPPFARTLIRVFGYARGDYFAEPGRVALVDWDKKPWNCWLCLSAWLGFVLRILWQFVYPPGPIVRVFIDPLIIGGASWIVAHWLDALLRYYESLARV